ncbi:16S rRNA (adenine(1518)-N(6)/adenine(1519)-N(6))-dimethyltransferase RsmA [Marinicella litoralis]|uniref:Ribosomal RNA small subunit methyltransferase A n=1 Tax=Marinicella litoralis TaxID=644220 RepID=A0A4R6XVF5_9GAMM|nr:16S rRNA (adenine(1518)-N(6)/adenine(1519)-N(6))-dimethyltransferase RsmA [Marinicella litoralis]TDR23816.1 dimethyladenosine transferase [Marinicella litoralis]
MKAKKALGQNFLQDEGVIHNIVKIINPQAGEKIIEIGPGQGAITQYLQASGADLQLIELDHDLIPILQQQFAVHDNVTLHHMDALKLQLEGGPFKVVGNLPYNISSPLLISMLYQSTEVSQMIFMLQKEVVKRICATPGEKLFGRLSVMLQHRFECIGHLSIPPEAFIPRPKVDSQIVQLVTKKDPTNVPLPALEKLVKQAFAMRRKTIWNNLKKMVSLAQMEAVGIDPGQRAETISVAQYEQLTLLLEQAC